MKYFYANTLEQYEKIVEPFRKDNWFRGHSTAGYRLEPNIYREKHFRCNLLGYNSRSIANPQSGIFDIFQYKIADDITKPKYPKYSFIKRMYKNQHYNVLTPLLDFSTNPLVALFFAVENRSKWNGKQSIDFIKGKYGSNWEDYVEDEAGAVFVISPLKLNSKSLNTKKILNSNDIQEDFVFSNDLPFAISPSTFNDRRVKAQSGKFVCFGLKMEPLDYYEVLERDITKIFIPNAVKQEIFEALIVKGYTYQKIYPDLEGVAKEANYQMWRDYKNRIKKYKEKIC